MSSVVPLEPSRMRPPPLRDLTDKSRRGFYARAIWAVDTLRQRPLSARALASEFGISLRTAYRDFDFLRDTWKADLDYDRDAGGFVMKGDMPSLPRARLTHGELVALLFAERIARQYRGTPFESDVRQAFKKVEPLFPAEVEVEGALLDSLVSLDLGPVHSADPATFRTVLQAASEARVLRARYTSLSSNATRVRELHPYRIFNMKGDWYVAAFDPGHREVRDFAMHRFQSASVLKKRFVRDPSFDFEEYKARAFGIEKAARDAQAVRVRLRFSPHQSRWIRERQWHSTARLHEERGGGLTLDLDVVESSELVRWILQFGPEVEVIEPHSLRLQVATQLRKATGLYTIEGGQPVVPREGAEKKGPRPNRPAATLRPKGGVL